MNYNGFPISSDIANNGSQSLTGVVVIERSTEALNAQEKGFSGLLSHN
jgi:hypothetical protein